MTWTCVSVGSGNASIVRFLYAYQPPIAKRDRGDEHDQTRAQRAREKASSMNGDGATKHATFHRSRSPAPARDRSLVPPDRIPHCGLLPSASLRSKLHARADEVAALRRYRCECGPSGRRSCSSMTIRSCASSCDTGSRSSTSRSTSRASGDDAFAYLATAPDVDVVVTDLAMPGHARLRAHRSDRLESRRSCP